MILNKLTLKEYKKYKDETIEFYDGTTGVLGANGAGKTTIVEAILFSLYGIKNTGLNNSFINAADSDDFAHVSLEFSVGNDIYLIERKFKRGKNNRNTHKAKLFRNGELFVDSSSQIEIELEKIVGMNVSDFKNTVYSGQKEHMNIIKYSPAERAKWLMRMFHIDFLKREAEEELRTVEKDIENELLKYNVLSDTGNIEELKWNKTQLTTTIESNDVSIDQHKVKIDEYDKNISLVYSDINSKHKLESQLNDVKNDMKIIDNNIISQNSIRKSLKEEFDKITIASEKLLEYGNIEVDVKALKEKYDVYVEKYNEYLKYVEQCNSVGENISTNYKFVEKLNEELKEIENKEKLIEEYSEYINERNVKNGELADIEKKDEIYRDLSSKIETIDTEFKHLNEKSNEIAEKNEDKFVLNVRKEELEKEIVDIGLYKDRDENLSKLASYVERRNAINSDIKNRKDKIDNLTEDMVSAKTLIDKEDSLSVKGLGYKNDIDALTEQISKLDYSIKDNDAKLDEINIFLEELEKHGSDSKCPFCDKVLGKAYELLLNDSKNKSKQLLSDIEFAKSDIERIRGKIDATKESYLVITKKLEHIYDEKVRYSEYAKSVKEYSGEVIQFENNLKAICSKIDLLSEGDDYDKVEHKRVKTKLADLYIVKTEYDGICATIKKYESENLDNKLKEIENKIELLECDRNDYISELNMLDYDSEIKSVIKNRLVFLNEKYEEYLNLKTEISKKPNIITDIEKITSTIGELIIKRDNYNNEACSLNENGYTKLAIDELKSDVEMLNLKYDDYKGLVRVVNDLDGLKERDRAAVKAIERLDGELYEKNNVLSETLLKLDLYDADDVYNLKLEDFKLHRSKAQSELSEEIRLKSLNEKELSIITDKILEIEKYEKDIKELNTKLSLIKQTRRYINLYITHILKTIRNNIEDDASYMINEITDGKYTSIKLDENFDIFLEDNGEYYNVDRFSGGEQDNVALSIRIALSHYLMQIANSNDSTFLIFDEIFGSQDEIRRNNLLKSLKIQERYFPQILIITHMDSIDDEFTNKLFVEDSDGQSHSNYI